MWRDKRTVMPIHRVKFSLTTLTLETLRYFFLPLLGVVLASAMTTAVLTGALLLGDSLRASLRKLALDRLGRVDEAFIPGRFFRQDLAEEWHQQCPEYSHIVPLIRVSVSLENISQKVEPTPRANAVQLYGCTSEFWDLGQVGPRRIPHGREIVLNETTARLLNTATGDRLVIYLPEVKGIPAESVFGRRRDLLRPVVVTLVDVIPDRNLGAFQLGGSQETPRNAFVDLSWLAAEIGQPKKANVLLLSRGSSQDFRPSGERGHDGRLVVAPEDYGVQVQLTRRGYFHITTDRLIFEPSIERAVAQAMGDLKVERAFIYLAERVVGPGGDAWYATLAAMPLASQPPLGPFLDVEGKTLNTPGAEECIINEWISRQLGARPGDRIQLTWFSPEVSGGQVRRQTATLTVKAIVSLQEAAADPELIPEVRGLTDKATIVEWDPPFPFDPAKVTKEDETYWSKYRGTPKIYVSPEFATRHWSSVYGTTTSFRISPEHGLTESAVRKRLTLAISALGWKTDPVKEQSLRTSQGTTPFDLLFLAFNFFLIAAGALLSGLLFALNVQRRASQWGLVLALGWPRRKIVVWTLTESMLLAMLGACLGLPLGIGYAGMLIQALHTVWLPAIGVRFIELAVTGKSLFLGLVIGTASSLAATVGMASSLLRRSPHSLLTGEVNAAFTKKPRNANRDRVRLSRWLFPVSWLGLLIIAGCLAIAGLRSADERIQAAMFFVTGASILVGLWMALWTWLRGVYRHRSPISRLVGLGLRNLSRNAARSALTTILMGSAAFVVIAASSFRIELGDRPPDRNSGDGGFWLIGESDQPLFFDLNDSAGRRSLGLSPQEVAALEQVKIFQLRLRSGEDASCLNLYRTRQPAILGVGDDFIARDGFSFTKVQKENGGVPQNPWELLKRPVTTDLDNAFHVAAIVDDATAKYALQKWRGVGESLELELPSGKKARLEFVALLDNSIFQGKILISESAFRELFPEVGGYRQFLIEVPRATQLVEKKDTGETTANLVRQGLERTFAAEGLRFITTRQRLSALLAVQNTYLSTFQTLGGLGLFLGTFGLSAVVFRGLMERRSEIALLRAIGFSDFRIQLLILLENLGLLTFGLTIGGAGAVVAVTPQLFSGRGHIPWIATLEVGAAMLVIGLISGFLAGRWVLRQPLLPSLRRE